ncbi:MAG: Succinyl-diaminopimelate desuccinylase [Anaerolineae bacterium]|nr:Succinyl-diaminopimelate desuccinylase [Anaerolineae bacterium]
MVTDTLTYARNHRGDFLGELIELLRIPSISTLPEHKADVQAAAGWLADKLAAVGLENIKILPTPGHPVVYADWLHAGSDAPTVIIYGHYDVQPPDPLDEWLTPPFEPTIKGDKIYGRGTADDKGQFFAHVAAVESYLKTAGRLPVNVKFMLEGEEELGSTHLEEFVQEHLELLRADVALISDTGILDPDTPALITSVRGLVYMEVTLRGSSRDLHSGIYGGAVENPLNAMTQLLGSLRDAAGRVTIPGFYDKVRELTPAEREAINNGRFTEANVLAETGAPALFGEAGYTLAERVGARPTLDIHGIRGGFVGQGQKTVIPAAITAKVSMRLVADQDAAEIVELFTRHVTAICPKTMTITVETLSAKPGAMVDMSAPAIEAAAQAYEQVFGRRPLFVREGGSIPVVGMFTHLLHAPVVMMGFGLPDDGLHSPNEKFHLPNFYRGIETSIRYFELLAGPAGN